MTSPGKRLILSRTSKQKEAKPELPFPPLPIKEVKTETPYHPQTSINRFAPLSPYTSRPRLPYSALAQMQNIPSQISITPPKPNINRASSSSSSTTEWHINQNKLVLKVLEPMEEDLLKVGFHKLLDYLYPRDSHFYTTEYQNRSYYEAILKETNSVEITHNYKPNDPSYITHSKARILKVINPEEWAVKPFSYKALSTYPSYPFYNYTDYQQAWYNAFYLRSFTHSWFFYFDEKFASDYPRWFMRWFQYMGNISEAFPPSVLDGLNKYKQLFSQDNIPPFEYILQFSIIFKIPWIVSFNYKKIDAKDSSPPLLYREFSIKWWNKMRIDQANPIAVINYHNQTLQIKPEISSPSPSSSPIQDPDTIKRIQACSSPSEIQKILNEIKSSKQDSSQTPPSSPSLFQDAQDPYEDEVI